VLRKCEVWVAEDLCSKCSCSVGGKGLFPGNLNFPLTTIHSRMDSIYWAHLAVVLCLGMFVKSWCQGESDANFTAVYIVTLRQAPSAHYYGGELTRDSTGFKHASSWKIEYSQTKVLISLLLLVFFVFFSRQLRCNYV